MRPLLNLDDLRLICAIGEAGTLTGAATRAGVDHSTVFRRLGAIERRLGTQLFDRARDGYTATAADNATIAAGRRVIDAVGELERQLAGQDLRPSGSVRVTTTDTLLDLVTPIFATLRSVRPEITVETVVANAFHTLTRRDADIAIRPAAAAPEHLTGRRLATLATALYAAPAYLTRQPVTTALREHAWIGFDDSLDHLASARWMAAHVPPGRIVYRADSLLALRAAVREGMGLAALPCYLGDPDEGLGRVRSPLPEMAASLWLLTHPDLRRVARVRTVLDAIAAQLVEHRPLIEGARPGARPPGGPARLASTTN